MVEVPVTQLAVALSELDIECPSDKDSEKCFGERVGVCEDVPL